MLKRIEEINQCLDKGLYQAALALALTIPDICGQIEFQTDNVGARYVGWLDKYLSHDVLADDCIKGWFNTLSYVNIYKLRCSFLHSGNDCIKEANIDEFYIAKPGSIGVDPNGKTFGYKYGTKHVAGKEIHTATIDVRYLCESLCDAAKNYYNTRNESDFDPHTVVFKE